jgi:N-methylhydantoinase A
MSAAEQRLAVEIGGTFTDVMVLEPSSGGARIRPLKVFSTPRSPEVGVLEAVDRLQLDWQGVAEFLHGSTVGTNAVIERKGVATALVTTEGFRDLLEIQRGDKENIYDIFYQRPLPLVPRNRVFPIRERMLPDGRPLTPLDEEQVGRAALEMRAAGIQAVAISFLHSYANPAHEQRAKDVIQDVLPDALVLASSEMLPQFREYERTSTTAMGAYVAPIVVGYIETLTNELNKRGFTRRLLITQSNGGLLPASAIRHEVVRTLLSGPAAGVTGACHVARQAGIQDIVTLDMGGTSTDVCLVNGGNPLVTTENKLGGLPIAVPMIDIVSVGAGGGSIAWLDDGGMLRVGPQSAGAAPGPACYGRGGTAATVTDAQLYQGYLRPDHFAGGAYPLYREACQEAIGRLALQGNISSDQASSAITSIVEANMIRAIRLVSTQRGHDPRQYTLVAFGGAGPLHAVKLADELGMTSVLVPRHAGLLSAFGLLVADAVRDYVQTYVSVTGDMGSDVVRRQVERLVARATAEFAGYGFDPNQLVFYPTCDARYQGQAFELSIPLDEPLPSPSDIALRFHDEHKRRYGFSSPSEPVEIVNYRLRTVFPRPLEDWALTARADQPVVAEGRVLIGGEWQVCPFYERASLPIDYTIVGPAIVEEETSTCYIPPTWKADVTQHNSLLITCER